MTALSVHLWKEWRDHRSGGIGFAVSIVAFACLIAGLLGEEHLTGNLFAGVIVLGSLLGAVVLLILPSSRACARIVPWSAPDVGGSTSPLAPA